jgi:hypothetical protein
MKVYDIALMLIRAVTAIAIIRELVSVAYYGVRLALLASSAAGGSGYPGRTLPAFDGLSGRRLKQRGLPLRVADSSLASPGERIHVPQVELATQRRGEPMEVVADDGQFQIGRNAAEFVLTRI